MSKLSYPVFLKDKKGISHKKQAKEIGIEDTLEWNGISPLEITMIVSTVIKHQGPHYN